MQPEEPPSTTNARYRIGTVATLTGISTHALRAWERRYHGLQPVRTPGGDRLYNDQDIERLRLIKQLLEYGHAISEVANLPAGELETLLGKHPERTPPPVAPDSAAADIQESFFEALRIFDLEQAARILSRAAVALDPRTLIFEVAAPMIQEVGDRWESGDLRIAHEHAASSLFRNLLGALIRTYSPDSDAPDAVIATPANELHEFGALLVAMLAVSRGWRVTYLGPNLPAEEIAHVVEVRKAQLLLLSLVLRDEPARGAELKLLDRIVPTSVTIVAGGRAAEEARQWLPRAERIGTLRELDRFLQQRAAASHQNT